MPVESVFTDLALILKKKCIPFSSFLDLPIPIEACFWNLLMNVLLTHFSNTTKHGPM